MSPARTRAQAGFTIVEVMAAVLVLSTSLLASAKVFISSNNANLTSQRRAAGTHVAQRQLEELRKLDFSDDLAMATAGVDSGDTNHSHSQNSLMIGPNAGPTCKTSGYDYCGMCYASGYSYCGYERTLVTATGRVYPGGPNDPVHGRFTETFGGTTVTGTIYRYVTRRGECQPAATAAADAYPNGCSFRVDTKRITVGVKLDPTPNSNGQAKPIWLSSVVRDPSAGSVNSFTNPAGGAGNGYDTGTSLFHLYDTPCNSNTQGVLGNRPTRSTAQVVTANDAQSNVSVCVNGSAGSTARAADLMSGAFPTTPANLDILPWYSNDLAGGSEGLVMSRAVARTPNSSCSDAPTTYSKADESNNSTANTANKWNVHRWTTPDVSSLAGWTGSPKTRSIGRVSVRLSARLQGSAGANAVICATLLKRVEKNVAIGGNNANSSYVTSETPLVSTRINHAWGTSSGNKWASFSRRFMKNVTNPAGSVPDALVVTKDTTASTTTRLVLAISISGASGDNLVLGYGHPARDSHLTIEDCGATGTPAACDP